MQIIYPGRVVLSPEKKNKYKYKCFAHGGWSCSPENTQQNKQEIQQAVLTSHVHVLMKHLMQSPSVHPLSLLLALGSEVGGNHGKDCDDGDLGGDNDGDLNGGDDG